MKRRRVLPVVVGAVIFLLLVFLSFAVVRPVYYALTESLSMLERGLMRMAGERTGLAVSYRSLSPSLLSRAGVSQIAISDAESGRVLARVRSASLSYDIWKILSGDPLGALGTLAVSGVEVEFDALRDRALVDRLVELFGGGGSAASDGGALKFEGLSLPFSVVVRDVSLHYSDESNDVRLRLARVSLDSGGPNGGGGTKSSGGISFSAEGGAEARSELLRDGSGRALAAASFGVAGTLTAGLEGSSATARITGDPNADYSLTSLDVLASYEDGRLRLRTMRTSLPFSAFAEYDFGGEKAVLALDADSFDPLSLVQLRRKPEALRKVAGTTVSGSAEVEVSLAGGKVGGISYRADMAASLPASVVGERLRVAFRGEGNERFVNARRLSASGRSVDASWTGSLDLLSLQPSGVLDLSRYTLPNGGRISGEVWAEPWRGGTRLVIPVAMLGERPVSAEAFVFPGKDSVDFSAELTDYSHAEDYGKATVAVDGSVMLGERPFVQARAEVDSLFADTALLAAAFFLPEEKAAPLVEAAPSLSTYVLSRLEVFGSSDFRTFSFNAPYGVAANTARSDSEFGTFAVDGSNEGIQLSSLDLQYGGFSVQAEASVDLSGGGDALAFTLATTVNSLPYRFAGSVSPQWLSVSGDYGFDAMVSLSPPLSGFVQFTSLPVSVGDYVLSLSTMSSFEWGEDGPSAKVSRLDVSEPTGRLAMEPRVSISGELSKYGFVFDALSYTDVGSELDMTGSLSWSLSGDALEFARVDLSGGSPISPERVSVLAELTNPAQLPFAEASVADDYYLSATVSLESFPFSRLLQGQGADSVLDAEVSASGTLSDPFVSAEVRRASLVVSGLPLEAHGRAVLDDAGVSVEDVDVSWAFVDVRGFSAEFDPKTFSGSARATAEVELAGKTLSAPVEISASGVPDGEDGGAFRIPDFYSVSVSSPGLTGSLFRRPIPFSLNAVHIPGQFDIFSDDPHGFKASVSEDGHFTATTGRNDALSFVAEGALGEGGAMDIFVTGIEADLAKLTADVDMPFVSFGGGRLAGNVRLSGLTGDPEFAGALQVDGLSLTVPMVSKSEISAETVQITAGAEGVNMPETPFSVGTGRVMVSSDVTFDRWDIANIFLTLRSVGGRGVPVDMTLPMLHVAGEARADLDISVILPDDMIVQGSISADRMDVEITANEIQEKLSLEGVLRSIPLDLLLGRGSADEPEEGAAQPPMNVVASLDLNAGNQVRIAFNPFLRALVAPGTSLGFSMDSATGEFAVNGDVTLHGGEISWLNRNFYLREGRIVFNETQDNIDPLVTVRAETREQDEDGNRVTITLSAQSQPVSRFSPQFSASPAKSEFEIMALLGQVISADAEGVSDIAIAGGDYLVQATVVRKLENALRELLNFDIFSLRTNVLQNAVKAGMGRSGTGADGEKKKEDVTFGNFFDNSTVYFGKYFGSSIYLDAMFHWTYDKTKLDDGTSVNGIVFQPEFGFEMASPFVNIRLGVAPSIESIQQNMWVQSSSITLSWKHQF